MESGIKSPKHFMNLIISGLFLMVILCLHLTAFTQSDTIVNKHTIGLSLFKIEQNRVTLNEKLEAKFYSGIQYEYSFSSFSLNADFEYAVNTINDRCRKCADTYYGKGHLSELNLFLGTKYSFFKKQSFVFTPFIEINGYLSRTIYSGNFQGGFFGTGIEFNNLYYIIGGMAQIGVDVFLGKDFTLSLACSGRMGTAWKSDNYHFVYEPTFIKTYDTALTPIHIGLGYKF